MGSNCCTGKGQGGNEEVVEAASTAITLPSDPFEGLREATMFYKDAQVMSIKK